VFPSATVERRPRCGAGGAAAPVARGRSHVLRGGGDPSRRRLGRTDARGVPPPALPAVDRDGSGRVRGRRGVRADLGHASRRRLRTSCQRTARGEGGHHCLPDRSRPAGGARVVSRGLDDRHRGPARLRVRHAARASRDRRGGLRREHRQRRPCLGRDGRLQQSGPVVQQARRPRRACAAARRRRRLRPGAGGAAASAI